MKKFRCVFQRGTHGELYELMAPDARTAAFRAAAEFPHLAFERVDVEDERGIAYMWQPRPGKSSSSSGQSAA